MKSEPGACSIDDLARKRVDSWEGVRNYQARNLMRDELKIGDLVLFYHSSADPSGVAGLARVVREAYPDHTAFDPSSPYHDPRSDRDDPTWLMVDVEFVEKFVSLVPLSVLQKTPGLEDMMVTRKGMRLSVQPVKPAEWDIVVALGRNPALAASQTSDPGKLAKKPARRLVRKSPRSGKPNPLRGGGAKKTARSAGPGDPGTRPPEP